MTDHAPVFGPALIEKHKDLKMGCASCHMEHNGTTGLIVRNSALCTNCHGDIKRLIPEAQAQNVPRFDKHPEFTVMIQPPIPGGAYTRVRLDDPANLKDNSNVKLNHQKHLATLNGPKGKVKLECRSCHEPSDDLRTIKPISYDKHCQECHGLEFDDRLKGRQVPHGSADVVYRYLYAEYAKLALSQTPEDKPIQEVFNLRGRPGSVMPSVAAQPKQGEDFTRAFVEKESRDSERKLFTKTACFLCHRVAPKEITPEEAASKQTGLFTVLQPDIPNRWMPHSIFSHGAHEAVKCEECHHGVSESNRTQDVLMPKVGDCTGCHSEEGDHGTVKSDCVMCHSFHDQLTVPEDRKRQIDKILAAVH
jgi:predicted CXXCH cytochrome family protein